MRTRNIIAVLWVASVMGGCAQSSTVVTTPQNRVASSEGPSVSKGTTYMNGCVLANGAILANGATFNNGAMFPNGASLANGKSRALALTNLASRPLAKKN